MAKLLKADILKSLQAAQERIEKTFSDCDWQFLNLNVKNCDASEQSKMLAKINYAFLKLTKHHDWPAIGWVKTIKIHRDRGLGPERQLYVQTLLLIKPQFFNVTQEEWANLWQSALKLTYTPVTNIQEVTSKPNRSATAVALIDVLNHMTKDAIFFKSVSLSTGGCLTDPTFFSTSNPAKSHELVVGL